ncbi:response regulator [Fundidesulfovibrio putealis]|uniref:response regulator n=1 Tax=Fundidesulfovibrio putealis TaxID=270496 RepID=UPI00040B92E4|nr:response regulator [Fundidesulfovibrio putealis]
MSDAHSEPGTGITILIVDDELLLRNSLRDYFEDTGFAVIAANSGEEALHLLRSGARVDLCTVDIRLPGMTGNQFIAEAHAFNPGLKFLVYTGSWNYELPAELARLDIGPEQVFNKPCMDLDCILQVILKLLGRV